MYEVRWTRTDGRDECYPYDNRQDADRLYSLLEGSKSVDSVGLYYTDGDGNEKVLATWIR